MPIGTIVTGVAAAGYYGYLCIRHGRKKANEVIEDKYHSTRASATLFLETHFPKEIFLRRKYQVIRTLFIGSGIGFLYFL